MENGLAHTHGERASSWPGRRVHLCKSQTAKDDARIHRMAMFKLVLGSCGFAQAFVVAPVFMGMVLVAFIIIAHPRAIIACPGIPRLDRP